MEDLSKINDDIEAAEYNLSKMGIFGYGTLDEADSSKERLGRDVTVEIGGPSTHIKITILTRKEHTKVKNLIETILNDRLKDANKRLDEFCKNRYLSS